MHDAPTKMTEPPKVGTGGSSGEATKRAHRTSPPRAGPVHKEFAKVLRERGIDAASAATLGLCHVEPPEHAKLMNDERIDAPGIVIPYTNLDGTFADFIRT